MNQTIADLRNAIALGNVNYDSYEVYAYNDKVAQTRPIHSDFITFLGEELDDLPDWMPCEWREMDEEEYNHTVDANVSSYSYFDNPEDTWLVIMLPYNYKDYLQFALYSQPAAMPGVPCPCGPGASIDWDEAEEIAVDSQESIIDQLFGISNKLLGTDYISEEFLMGANYDKVVRCKRDIVAVMNVGDKDYFAVPYFYIANNQTDLLFLKEEEHFENYPML